MKINNVETSPTNTPPHPTPPLTSLPVPPKPRRDSNLVTLIGKIPNPPAPRQSSTSTNPLLDPPISLPDPYGWMRDESRSPASESYQHLIEENEYTTALTNHLRPLRDELYNEMVGRMKQTDCGIPAPWKRYVYYSRTIEGQGYVWHCRARRDDTVVIDNNGGSSCTTVATTAAAVASADQPIFASEEVYLNENELATGCDYCGTGTVEISSNEDRLGYMLDTTGNENYDLIVKDLTSGEIIHQSDDLKLDETFVWGESNDEVFVVELDDVERPFRVRRRLLLSEGGDFEDTIIFQDLDDIFSVELSKSLDDEYLFVTSSSMDTSEVWILPLKKKGELKCIAKRRDKVLYDVVHHHGRFLIVTNVGGSKEMRLMTVEVDQNEDHWRDVTSESGDILFGDGTERVLDGVTSFDSHTVVSGREDGLPRLWIMTLEGNTAKSFTPLEFDEMSYDIGLGPNYEFHSTSVVVTYSSLTTPLQHIQIPFDDPQNRVLLKQKEVPGYNPELYASERLDVLSRDGQTKIPVSLVYRKSTLERHQSTRRAIPTHLYAYGAYGMVEYDGFDSTILPLLDRGIVYVVAHVRGGGERGRKWYEEPHGGKCLCKKNTFHDYIDVAKCLIYERQLTDATMLSCEGRSAGGYTVATSINMNPELFKTAILGVPAVDSIGSMVDSTIPLVAGEWEEWGNPNEEKYFSYMLSIDPISNIQKVKYPSMLITSGLHDPRVQYWEPAKFVATLRHEQGHDSGPILLKMELSSGHFSASDRYKYLRELSFDYSFLLGELDLVNVSKE